MQNDAAYKYGEGDILAELNEYIDSTYGQHYVSGNGLQTIDVWESLGIAEEVCRGTVLKYIMRYGKKEGHNKKDLLKALHYTILLWHFTQKNEVKEKDFAILLNEVEEPVWKPFA